MKERKEKEKRLSPQSIVQDACALGNWLHNIKARPHRESSKAKARKLKLRIRQQIDLYGSVEAIDSILELSDPYHSRLSEVLNSITSRGFDLPSLLPRKNKTQ